MVGLQLPRRLIAAVPTPTPTLTPLSPRSRNPGASPLQFRSRRGSSLATFCSHVLACPPLPLFLFLPSTPSHLFPLALSHITPAQPPLPTARCWITPNFPAFRWAFFYGPLGQRSSCAYLPSLPLALTTPKPARSHASAFSHRSTTSPLLRAPSRPHHRCHSADSGNRSNAAGTVHGHRRAPGPLVARCRTAR